MLELVGGELGGDDGQAAEIVLAEPGIAADRSGFAADLGDLALVRNGEETHELLPPGDRDTGSPRPAWIEWRTRCRGGASR